MTAGWRRRCSWCGVQLRGWQLNLCQLCKPRATGDAGIYLQSGGPPCGQAARWTDVPDRSKIAERWLRWWDEQPVEAGVVCWTACMVLLCVLAVGAGFLFG